MIEISSRPIRNVLRIAETRFGVDVASLLEFMPEDTSAISPGHSRIPWEVFCSLLERLEEAIGGRQATKDFFGELWGNGERKGFLGGLAAHFADSRQLYRYATNIYAPEHLPILACSLEIQSDGTIALDTRIPIEARNCPVFWWGLGSFLRRIPCLLGQSEALVDIEVGDRQAIYRITPPPPLTIAVRFRNSIRGFFAHKTAAEMAKEQAAEIERVHKTLIETREQMEREIVKASQREQQRVAHDLHDSLGQQLTAVSLQAALLEATLKECAPEFADEATQIAREVKEASQFARRLAHGLGEIGRRNGGTPESPSTR